MRVINCKINPVSMQVKTLIRDKNNWQYIVHFLPASNHGHSTPSRGPLFCFYHILTSWNLFFFYSIKIEMFYWKSCEIFGVWGKTKTNQLTWSDVDLAWSKLMRLSCNRSLATTNKNARLGPFYFHLSILLLCPHHVLDVVGYPKSSL